MESAVNYFTPAELSPIEQDPKDYCSIPEGTYERFHKEAAIQQSENNPWNTRVDDVLNYGAKLFGGGSNGVSQTSTSTEQLSSILGAAGEIAYGDGYKFEGKGLALKKNFILGVGNSLNIEEFGKTGQYDIDYSALTLNTLGRPYRKNQIVSQSYYGKSPGSPIDGDVSQQIKIQSIDALITASINHGLNVHDTAYVLAIARHESGFNPYAAAGTTSASGLGQFIKETGSQYGIKDGNRWNVTVQANALVEHFLDNKAIVQNKKLPAAYIYKFHHDGPKKNYGGLDISYKKIIPRVGSIKNVIEKLF